MLIHMQRLRQKAFETLRKSERFFRTDMVYVARGGFWLGFGQVAAALISFGSSLVFANYISKDLYGNYRFILTAAGILAAFSLTGMGSVITQGVAKDAEGILKDAVKVTLRWGTIIALASIFISAYYFAHGNITLGIAALIIGVNLPISNAFTLYGNYLSGKKDFKRIALYSVISQALVTATMLITAITTRNVLLMVAVYFFTNTLVTYFSYKHIMSIFHLNNIKDHTLIPYSKHLSAMNLFGTIANQLDKVLIFHYLGAVNLAIYSFSQAIPDQIKGSFKNLFGIALPKYASLSETDMRESIKKKFVQLTLITIALITAYILSAPYIFEYLFPKYIEAVSYSQIYILGLLTIPGISLCAIYFQLKKATRTMYKLNIIGNVSTLLITIPLIYKYGLLGAVIANGLSWTIMLTANFYYFVRDRKKREIEI